MRSRGGWRRGRRWRVQVKERHQSDEAKLSGGRVGNDFIRFQHSSDEQETKYQSKFNISDDLFNAREDCFLISTTLMTTKTHTLETLTSKAYCLFVLLGVLVYFAQPPYLYAYHFLLTPIAGDS